MATVDAELAARISIWRSLGAWLRSLAMTGCAGAGAEVRRAWVHRWFSVAFNREASARGHLLYKTASVPR